MLVQLLYPLWLPVLQLVTLATVPATALYALLGLLSTPIIVPILITLRFVRFALFFPLLLLTLPVAVPVAGFLAFLCTSMEVVCALFTVFTPLLWPLKFMCKWWRITSLIGQVMITDTIAPWLVPIRFTFLAALLPKLVL